MQDFLNFLNVAQQLLEKHFCALRVLVTICFFLLRELGNADELFLSEQRPELLCDMGSRGSQQRDGSFERGSQRLAARFFHAAATLHIPPKLVRYFKEAMLQCGAKRKGVVGPQAIGCVSTYPAAQIAIEKHLLARLCTTAGLC